METFESISIIYSTYHSQRCLIHYPQCCTIMQRRQSRTHTRGRTHFACHTLSPELRSVTLNYSANKTCRPKQRTSLPHTHTHTQNVIHPWKRVLWLHITSLFINVMSHARITPPWDPRSGFFSCIPLSTFNHLASFNLALWSPFSLSISLSFPSCSLYFPLPSINASVETINKNNDLFKNPQYGSLANEVAGDKLRRLLLTPTCLLIPHVFLNVWSGLYFKMS